MSIEWLSVARASVGSSIGLRAVDQIEQLHQRLRYAISQPQAWGELLRRFALAKAIQASNSIKGPVPLGMNGPQPPAIATP